MRTIEPSPFGYSYDSHDGNLNSHPLNVEAGEEKERDTADAAYERVIRVQPRGWATQAPPDVPVL